MKIDIKESETVEFKESLSQLDKGLKSLSAMLNRSSHGALYFGVKDDGSIRGVTIGEHTYQDIRRRASELIKPKIVLDIAKKVIGGKDVVVVASSGNDTPYSCDGLYFIRNVASDEQVDNHLLKRMFEIGDSDLIKNHESYEQDLTFHQFVEYSKARGIHATHTENFLKSKGLYTLDKKFNYLAYLLSDQNAVSIKIVRFSGETKASFSERTEYGFKCLLRSVDEVLNAIKAINVTRIEVDEGVRKETPLFNFEAFREAWINACMHNHWIDMFPPSVFLFDNRIEIFSYGNKPFNLTDDQFYSGISSPINKALSDIFMSLRLSEQSGHGIPIITEKYGREAFSFKGDTLTVTLPFNYTPDNVIGRKTREISAKSLTEKQSAILRYLEEHGDATQAEVASALPISVQGVKKAILKLQTLDMLTRVGSKKSGHWEVKYPNDSRL